MLCTLSYGRRFSLKKKFVKQYKRFCEYYYRAAFPLIVHTYHYRIPRKPHIYLYFLITFILCLRCGHALHQITHRWDIVDIPLLCLLVLLVLCTVITLALFIKLWRDEACLGIAITSNHGSTLTEVIHGLHNAKYEYCALFDRAGQKLIECTTACRSSVDMNITDFRKFCPHYSELIEVHNHPDKDSPFSAVDIGLILLRRPLLSIVVAEKYIYCLSPTPDTPTYTEEEYDEWLKDSIKETYSSLEWSYGIRRPTSSYSQIQRDICQAIATELCLEFSFTPVSAPFIPPIPIQNSPD